MSKHSYVEFKINDLNPSNKITKMSRRFLIEYMYVYKTLLFSKIFSYEIIINFQKSYTVETISHEAYYFVERVEKLSFLTIYFNNF